MAVADYFPIWDKLTQSQQEQLEQSARRRTVARGTLVHNGSGDCVGLFLIGSGQLRAYSLSPQGREVTLYRLFERDICLFSASCIMASIQFDMVIEAEKDCELWVIPPDLYKTMMEQSAPLANYTNEIMAARFTEVMWRMEQMMWNRFDQRLAGFLLEESALENSDILRMTHDKIASHMGTAREVVTRMLRYFQSEGIVTLNRGEIFLENKQKLHDLSVQN